MHCTIEHGVSPHTRPTPTRMNILILIHRLMLRDPRLYGPTSEEFDPNRFMTDTGVPDPTWIPFGFGRRYVSQISMTMQLLIHGTSVCAGRFLAQRIAMQFAAATLSAFEVVLMHTDDGNTLTASNTTFHEETIR